MKMLFQTSIAFWSLPAPYISITSAEAEPSFSLMKWMKTWFGSTVSEERSAFVLKTTKHWNYLSWKFKLLSCLSQVAICYWNSTTISQLSFDRLLVNDFCSNNFSEIYVAYLLYQSKLSAIFFTRSEFLWTVRSFLSANFAKIIYRQWNRNISYYYINRFCDKY